jgi:hypothetical protein
MFFWEEDVEAHALRRRSWSISMIARHLGHDRHGHTTAHLPVARRAPNLHLREDVIVGRILA